MAPYERLSVSDRIFLEMESHEGHLHVAGCFTFDAGPLRSAHGGIDIDRVSSYVESRLHRIPRYRQRIHYVPYERDPIWVDDPTFNLHYHIRHTHLPPPGDERLLKRLCGRIVSQLLDRGKPLWEMWIVDGLEGNRFAVITKVHHCMTDGVGGVELLGNLLAPAPAEHFEDGPSWLPRAAPTRQRLIRDAVARRMRAPRTLLEGLADAVRDPAATLDALRQNLDGLREAGDYTVNPASKTPINEPIGGHRRFDWMSMELDTLRGVKKQVGGTINDVALTIATGAFSRFLEGRGIGVREQEALDFRASCPVNVRSEGEEHDLGNRVANLIVQLPLAERDPVRRLERIHATMKELKSSNQVRVMGVVESVAELTHPSLLTAFARINLERGSSNFVFTNVPGPQSPWYLLEAKLLETYPIVPIMPKQGVGIAVMSYAGVLYWGFNSDWEQLPDLHDLVLANAASLRELCAAAGVEAPPA